MKENKLEELIKKLCPNGVEYKKLENCCNILDNERKPVTKSARIKGEYPYYGANGIQDYVSDYIFDGTFVLVGEDGSVINKNGNPVVTWAEGKIWVNNHAHVIKEKENVLLRYLYHYIQTINVSVLIHGNIPKLNQGDFRNLRIAVPPLEVQCEIVHILDDFTLLSAELSAELKARQKQYEYYASKLFTSFKAKDYPMGELAKFVYGYTDKAIDNGNTRFIRITDINEQGCLKKDDIKYINMNEEAQKSLLKKGDLVMARTGATFGKTLYFDDDVPSVYASFLIKIIPDNTKLLNKYYWHFTKTQLYWSQANKLVTNGGQPQFNTPALKKIRIPIPTIDEQHKVVDILDRLDKICNDISEGLPAEIEARKKQYEYYRDKLLTFKELKVNE